MIASLMMYARPELAEAHKNYWNLIRRHLALAGIDSPPLLSQEQEEFSVWRDPQLVLSQTCGMPYGKFLHGEVKLVGTPDFSVAGCPPGYYRSAIIVHTDDTRTDILSFKGDTFAYNQTISQSGYAAMYAYTASYGFWFQTTLQTHSHLASARSVAEKRVGIAAVDAVTWRLIRKYETFASELRVLDWTLPTPGLPYITSVTMDAGKVFTAVSNALDDLTDKDRMLLGITGLLKIPAEDYLSVLNPPDD